MFKYRQILLFAGILYAITSVITFAQDGLTIISPNGGEVLSSGTKYNITWSTSGLISNVKLEYSIDNGVSWSTITSSTTNTGVYIWTVPNIGTWRAKVRISDAEDSSIGDRSNSRFKIQHVVYPTTGNTLFVDPDAAFGPRLLNGVYDFHRGIDFPGTYNVPIHAAMPGVIVRKLIAEQTVGTPLERSGNFLLVKIDSANGEPRHNAYAHLNGFYKFNVGDTVSTLDTIGFMGKSGVDIYTVHLHFELYKNLNDTLINKDKAKNAIEILPYTNSNSYVVDFLTSGDSSGVEVSVPETELDFDGLTIYGSLASRTIRFNSRVGIDPNNNDNPNYNNVFIDPIRFVGDSSTKRIRFWTKNNVIGTIDSIKLYDVKGYSVTISQSSLGDRYAVTSGNWNDAIWASTPGGGAGSASTPNNLNDVIINSNVTVTVSDANAVCNNISFGSTNAKLAFTPNSVLSIHGDFTLASTTHNAFSSWASGAKLRFTGGQAVQTIKNLYKDASTFSSSFMELVVDKSSGKVTVEDSARLNIGTSMEIINGTFELAYRADIEGRNLTGSSTSAPTITVQSGGVFNMIGSLSHIRSGTSGTNQIGKMTLYGTAILRSTSSLGIAIGNIDVKNGGVLMFNSFSSTFSKVINPGLITIESGGILEVNSAMNFYHSSSSVDLQSGGNYKINANPVDINYSFPSAFTNNGTVEYLREGEQSIKNITYKNLTVSGSGNKILTGNIEVQGALSITGGSLVTGDYTIIMGESATISENTGSTVVGKIIASRDIIQNTQNDFGGIGVIINAAGNNPGMTTITRTTGTAIIQGENESIKRYFDIAPANNTNLNATLTFKYDESELNGLSENTLVLFKSSDNGTSWFNEEGSVDMALNSITKTGVNSFSRWTAGSVNHPLPVKFSVFTIEKNKNSAILNWETTTEYNFIRYEIERISSRADSQRNWEKIGELFSKGYSFAKQNYRYIDENLNTGFYSYRIKIIDNDGTFSYSNEVDIEIEAPDKFELHQNYPNPFNPVTTISFTLAKNEHIKVEVVTITGELVDVLANGFFEAGYYKLNFDGRNLSSGFYFCRLRTKNFTKTIKLSLIK
jgi:murein DD-endopeptidase MepM/ murein hydrolase activator NlpD